MPGYGQSISPDMARIVAEIVRDVSLDFGGGSSEAKALVFADLIVRFGVEDAIEIGVYRGRSLLPIAAMLQAQGAGRVIGIDPWSSAAALQDDTHEVGPAVNEWARSHPWEETYTEVVSRIERLGLKAHCELRRMTSEAAAGRIPDNSVDLVHIDGNHDRAAVELDVKLYLPKLRAGGFMALDDASWSSVRPLVEALRAPLELVFQLFDGIPLHDQQPTDFAVFRVPDDW